MKLVASSARAVWLALPLAGASVLAPASGVFAANVTHSTATCVIARPAAGGMVVGLDPETGLPGAPTAEQVARLAGMMRSGRTLTRPSPVYRSNGTVSLDVRSWMRDFSIVRLGPDGRPVLGCFDDLATALRARSAPLPTALEER